MFFPCTHITFLPMLMCCRYRSLWLLWKCPFNWQLWSTAPANNLGLVHAVAGALLCYLNKEWSLRWKKREVWGEREQVWQFMIDDWPSSQAWHLPLTLLHLQQSHQCVVCLLPTTTRQINTMQRTKSHSATYCWVDTRPQGHILHVD